MLKRLIASLICLSFSFSNLQYIQAQDFSVNQLPVPGTIVGISASFTPLALKGLIVNPQKPLEFQFIVDTGNGPQDTASIKEQSNQLVKYFLAGLTIPEGDLWVNLSPYEKNRMVPEALGQTDLGRDLLAQDYILKQLTASLIYPEKDLGKEFWRRVYAKAQAQFGTTNIPVNTFNKVWILPNQAQVFEHGNAAYVTKSTLKVMLDEDYTALQKHMPVRNGTDSIGSNIVREIVIPEITKEVNTGKNFAPLRQIYQALILSKWYKETIRNSLLDAIYTNKNKVAGVNLSDPTVKEKIYDRYLQAYKKGVFNYIKEDPTPDGQVMPKKYFSGGITKLEPDQVDIKGTPAMISSDGAMLSLTVSIYPWETQGAIKASKEHDSAMLSKRLKIRYWQSTNNIEEIEKMLNDENWKVLLAANKAFRSVGASKARMIEVYRTISEAGSYNARLNAKEQIEEISASERERINTSARREFLVSAGRVVGLMAVTSVVGSKSAHAQSSQDIREIIKKIKETMNGNQTTLGQLYYQLCAYLDHKEAFSTIENYLKIEKNSNNPDDPIAAKIVDGTIKFFTTHNKSTFLNKTKNGPLKKIIEIFVDDNDKASLAQQQPGGIDLNQINIDHNGKAVNVLFDQAQLNELMQDGFEGFRPVITGIKRISSPLAFLGVSSVK